MPAALLQNLKMILSLGGGLAGERGISALLSKLGPKAAQSMPQLMAGGRLGGILRGAGKFGAQTGGFIAGQSAVE